MEENNGKSKGYYSKLTGFKRAVPIILGALALFIAICFISDGAGALGNSIKPLLLGLFSAGAYSIPVLLLLHAVFYAEDVAKKRVLSRTIFSVLVLLFICAIEYTIFFWGEEMLFSPVQFFNDKTAGGFIGSTVAFGLAKALGPIGVYILAAALVAIYVSFFFANKDSAFGKAVFAVLGFFLGILALIERGIKAIIKFFKNSGEKKKKKEAEKKNRELLDDQFFKVDDGMSELKIKELGITETSESGTEESVSIKFGKPEPKAEPLSTEEDVKAKRSFNLDYGLEHGMFDAIFEKEPKTEPKIFDEERPLQQNKAEELSCGLDESAEKFFTKDFDPFDFALNQKIASKASTGMGKVETAGVSEVTRPLSSMSDEELAKQRRNMEFEKRKQMIINKRSETASGRDSESVFATVKESASSCKTVEYNVTNEPKVIERAPRDGSVFKGTFDKQEHREQDAEAAAAHIAEVVQMNNPTYMRSANQMRTYMKITETPSDSESAQVKAGASDFKAETVSPDTFEAELVNIEENTVFEEQKNDGSSDFTEFKPYTPPSVEDYSPVASEQTEDTLIVERTMLSPSPVSSYAEEPTPMVEESAKNFEEDRKEETVTSTVISEPIETPRVSVVNERDNKYTLLSENMQVLEEKDDEEDGSDSALTFTFEEEPTVENKFSINTAPIPDEGTVFSFDDEEETEETEEEIYNEIPEEDAITSEEIPPEHQNPDVLKQREMFPFLNESSEEPEAQEDSASLEEDAIRTFEQTFANEAEEVEENDEPPFEIEEKKPAPTVSLVPAKEAAKEKKESKKPDYSNYEFPTIEFLGKDVKEIEGDVDEEIQENADKLIETLASFNVTASIKGVDRGPRITRYEVVPARGVKVSSVMNLQDDIALGLAAEGIRMEAPIPGKSAIGVEIPNIHEETVRLRELLETEDFINAKSKTTICIGKDVTGQPVINDIAKMPHLLIAGATGMGKSVCINSLMISILYKARPDEVKFIMIDPKQVEFTMYNGIPHLLVPVVSDAKQAAGALMWAVEEMERRYNILNTQYVRNVDAYNEKVKDDPTIGEPMSRIVIVIDEFADLMLQVRDPVENLVMRIAQKARAAGIHLIIGTQRPAVNVITGTIKANVPSRISCKVASNTDSRTVLDAGGAEKLLNKGDMLFSFAGAIKPLRVQGAFVKDSEVEAIMKYLKQFSNGENYDQSVMEEIERAAQKCSKKGGGSDMEDDDDQSSGEGYLNDRQFLDAVELAVNSGRIATSLIQRKLSIGYGKAAKFIDIMEDMGIVGEGNGPKPREVLISADEWREKLARSMID